MQYPLPTVLGMLMLLVPCCVLMQCVLSCGLFFFFVTYVYNFPLIFGTTLFNFLCGALEFLCCRAFFARSSSNPEWSFTSAGFFFRELYPYFEPRFKASVSLHYVNTISSTDSTYSSFTFIDLSHPSAKQPVKNLILHSFKPALLKDSLELIGSLSLKRTQGNLMAEVKTAGERAGCIQHAFITKLSCWLEYG